MFVLGEVVNPKGELRIEHPSQGRFVISVKHAEKLIRGGKAAATGLLFGSLSTGAIGAVILVVAMLRDKGQVLCRDPSEN